MNLLDTLKEAVWQCGENKPLLASSILRAAIAELEAAEPVAWRYKTIPPYWTYSDRKPNKEFAGEYWDKWEVTSLYTHPAPAVPDAE